MQLRVSRDTLGVFHVQHVRVGVCWVAQQLLHMSLRAAADPWQAEGKQCAVGTRSQDGVSQGEEERGGGQFDALGGFAPQHTHIRPRYNTRIHNTSWQSRLLVVAPLLMEVVVQLLSVVLRIFFRLPRKKEHNCWDRSESIHVFHKYNRISQAERERESSGMDGDGDGAAGVIISCGENTELVSLGGWFRISSGWNNNAEYTIICMYHRIELQLLCWRRGGMEYELKT